MTHRNNGHIDSVVHIIEDDPLVSSATRLVLESSGYICREYGSAKEYLEARPVPSTGCVLLDVQMKGMNGFELEKKLKDLGCVLPIIFLTGQGTISMAVDAVKRGAFDFMEKPVDTLKLTELVGAAVSKSHNTAKAVALLENLTPREREIFDLLASGLINKSIGAKLDISQGTVEFHRSKIMRKLNAQGLEDLITISNTISQLALQRAQQ